MLCVVMCRVRFYTFVHRGRGRAGQAAEVETNHQTVSRATVTKSVVTCYILDHPNTLSHAFTLCLFNWVRSLVCQIRVLCILCILQIVAVGSSIYVHIHAERRS